MEKQYDIWPSGHMIRLHVEHTLPNKQNALYLWIKMSLYQIGGIFSLCSGLPLH